MHDVHTVLYTYHVYMVEQ